MCAAHTHLQPSMSSSARPFTCCLASASQPDQCILHSYIHQPATAERILYRLFIAWLHPDMTPRHAAKLTSYAPPLQLKAAVPSSLECSAARSATHTECPTASGIAHY